MIDTAYHIYKYNDLAGVQAAAQASSQPHIALVSASFLADISESTVVQETFSRQVFRA